MTTTTTETITAITTRTGATLWKSEERGPRGGLTVRYQERRAGESEPSAWRLWTRTQAEALDFLPVGTGAGI